MAAAIQKPFKEDLDRILPLYNAARKTSYTAQTLDETDMKFRKFYESKNGRW